MESHSPSNVKNVSLGLIATYDSSDSDSDETSTAGTLNDDLDSLQHSEMVLKNNIINAYAHGPCISTNEDSGTASHMIIDNDEREVRQSDVTNYRGLNSEILSSSGSSSDEDSDYEGYLSCDEDEQKLKKLEPPKVIGELELDDLPPVEDLAISLPPEETIKIGNIIWIVEKLVVVEAYPETPALDIDTVLFLNNGSSTLGKVLEVIGSVKMPHYCVRFNSEEHIKEKGVQTGMEVFMAPNNKQHTNYVFCSELAKMKGSDASWCHDLEPPSYCVEYSDDEEEKKAKQEMKQKLENTSKGVSKPKLSQRPFNSSSRFGSGSNRERNNTSSNFRRNNANTLPRFNLYNNEEARIPPHHPNSYNIACNPFSARPFNASPINAPPFNGPPFRAPPFNSPPISAPPFNAPPFRVSTFNAPPSNAPPVSAPPFLRYRPSVLPNFNPNIPPPQVIRQPSQFGWSPGIPSPNMLSNGPFNMNNGPVFGSNYWSQAGQRPHWNQPPPGT